MKRGSFVRRQLFLVVMTILITAVLISVTYGFYIQLVYVEQKSDEFSRNADMIWINYLAWFSGLIDNATYDVWLENAPIRWGADLAIYAPPDIRLFSNPETVPPRVEPYLATVVGGQDIVVSGGLFSPQKDLIVGKGFRDEAGNVIGVVFLIRPVAELSPAINSFNAALRLSIAAVLLIMLLPTYLFARLLSRPIFHMSTVALRMAKGDFTARANEASPGEIGELGMTLNYLAAELSFTIQALQLEKNRLASILDGLSEGILAVDAQGEITHLNPALLAMFGKKAQADEAYDHLSLIPEPSLWEDFNQTLVEKVPVVRSLILGSATLRVAISPLEGEDGRPAGAVGLFQDVTESERLEQTRRDYVANVSHELRTPISSVRGLTEALKDGLVKEEPDRQRYYGFILRETMRLTRLIEDLLELSRLQSGSMALKTVRVNIADLVMDFAELYHHTPEDVGIDFVPDLPEGCPDALTNADRVEQVLVILLDNAVKFTPEGGKVGLRVRWDERMVRIGVPDSGSGIAPEDLPHVFDRFYKADKAHTGHGTGLGLSIAREIVQQLGGNLTVTSELGRGTCFEIAVPRWNVEG